MNLAELKESIVSKNLRNVYIFTGDEIRVMDIYIKQIATVQKRIVTRKDSVASIYKQLKIKSLGEFSNVYVILNDMDFLKQEKYWQELFTATDNHTIILVYSHLDKRSKFCKQYGDNICEFEKLHESVLAKYIQKEIDLTTNSAICLATMCENSYNRILMEVDKLKHLQEVYGGTSEQIFQRALQSELIFTTKNEFTFQLVDAVCKRDVSTVSQLLYFLDPVKDSPIAILSLLYNNIKAMLLVSVCPPGAKVGETTGLNGFQIKLAYEKGHNYSPEELLKIMNKIKFIDEAIKIGRIEPQSALDYLVCEIM